MDKIISKANLSSQSFKGILTFFNYYSERFIFLPSFNSKLTVLHPDDEKQIIEYQNYNSIMPIFLSNDNSEIQLIASRNIEPHELVTMHAGIVVNDYELDLLYSTYK